MELKVFFFLLITQRKEIQKLLYLYCNIFPFEDIWEHIGFIFTKISESLPQDEFEENKKEKENEFKKGLIEQI